MAISNTPSPLSNLIAAKTYNAQWFSGSTIEAQITAAIAAAVADGALYVYVPANMLPYNATNVIFNASIRMLAEGYSDATMVNVKAYGAFGNGTTDDYAAFVAAHNALPASGGTIYIPPGIYRMSQAFNLLKPVHLIGSLPSTSVILTYTTTVLLFDADKDGVIVCGYLGIDNTTRASDPANPGANYAILENFFIVSKGGASGLSNGGTGIDVDGLKIRAPGVSTHGIRVLNFKRNGIRIAGAIGAGGALEGNCNLTHMWDMATSGSGSHGFYVDGADANACLFERIDSSNNGGHGIYDSGFLGNTYIGCHTSANALRSYVTDDINAAHVFVGCYAEVGVAGNEADLTNKTIVIGGNLSAQVNLLSTSNPVTIGALGTMWGTGLTWTNSLYPTPVTVLFGGTQDPTLGRVFAFTTSLDGATGWEMYFNQFSDSWWHLTNRRSSSRRAISFPDGSLSLRAYAPQFFEGFYFGKRLGAAGVYYTTSNAAPSSGTWNKGDIVFNDAPSMGLPLGWKCITAGTPGTWIPFGMENGFSADRGNADVTWAVGNQLTQRFNTVITADRAFNLPAAGVTNQGIRVRVVREASATGAFNINVKDSGGTTLKALGAASTWCDVESDGSTFRLTAAGTL